MSNRSGRYRREQDHAANRAYNIKHCPNLIKFADVPNKDQWPEFLLDVEYQSQFWRFSDIQIRIFNQVFYKARRYNR